MQTRYRNSLGDLAHSLKTPLAILQSSQTGSDATDASHSLVSEQVQRMDDIINHQLQRAAVSGRSTLAAPVAIDRVVRRLVRTLEKVYQDKPVTIDLDLQPGATFTGDETDLTEILGNLLDNACKYCRSTVRVTARTDHTPGGVEIRIEDDGPGIPADQVDTLLQRGRRMDESVPGQGIGLGMASEITALYGGELSFDTSNLGGTLVRVIFHHHPQVESGRRP